MLFPLSRKAFVVVHTNKITSVNLFNMSFIFILNCTFSVLGTLGSFACFGVARECAASKCANVRSAVFVRAALSITACVCAVAGFRSRVPSPTQSVERRYKLLTTRHPAIAANTLLWPVLCLKVGISLLSLIYYT